MDQAIAVGLFHVVGHGNGFVRLHDAPGQGRFHQGPHGGRLLRPARAQRLQGTHEGVHVVCIVTQF